MRTKPYPLRIPRGLLELAELRCKEERTDKATALRQLLYAGAEEYVLRLLEEGRLTVGRAAELLELSVYDLHRLAQDHRAKIGATEEQYRRARDTARGLSSQSEEPAG